MLTLLILLTLAPVGLSGLARLLARLIAVLGVFLGLLLLRLLLLVGLILVRHYMSPSTRKEFRYNTKSN